MPVPFLLLVILQKFQQPRIFKLLGLCKTIVLTDVHLKEPGDALYLPHGMPHAVYNLDDTVALTENYLFMGWQSVQYHCINAFSQMHCPIL